MIPEWLGSFLQDMRGITPANSGREIDPLVSFDESLLSAAELSTLDIPARECLVGTWWREGGQGFIFGPRGLGKTWLAMHLAQCLAEGRPCGPWPVPKPRRVLYVDGEMALDSLRDRSNSLAQSKSGLLYFLSHQQIFENSQRALNLSGFNAQRALTDLCVKKGIEVVILDNLSCLFSGLRENDADYWEPVQKWLLELRRMKIAVCIVHHSGRNGTNMRGTSRREDAAIWVMRLDPPSAADSFEGARFIGRFTKNREGSEVDAGPWQWTFTTPPGSTTEVHHARMDNLDMFVQLVRDGVESCTDIATEIGVTPGTVSKWAKRAATAGQIKIVGKRYLPS